MSSGHKIVWYCFAMRLPVFRGWSVKILVESRPVSAMTRIKRACTTPSHIANNQRVGDSTTYHSCWMVLQAAVWLAALASHSFVLL